MSEARWRRPEWVFRDLSAHRSGAAALNRIARLRIDPRDERTDSDHFELIGTDAGVFGCMGLPACEDVCPKNLPLQNQLGFLRHKLGITALKRIFTKG